MRSLIINLYVLILASTKGDREIASFSAKCQITLVLFFYFLSASIICIQYAFREVEISIMETLEWKIFIFIVGGAFYYVINRVVGGVSMPGARGLYLKLDFGDKVLLKSVMVFSILLPLAIAIFYSLNG